MIVPRFEPEESDDRVQDFDPQPSFFSGGCSGWMEPSEQSKRRIGFRMPEPEELPPSPDWMLI